MRYITVENTSKRDFHQFMLGGVTPRPIALVSTISKDGVRNLAPYSYFNAVSSIPPILMVSIGRKQDGTKKDTLINVEETGEFVVNMVPESLLQQMAISSVQLPSNSDEFDLAGLQGKASQIIKPDRVLSSPIHFECRLNRIVTFGEGPGESTLIFGDVQCIHVDERIIDENNRIDPTLLRIAGRLGRSYYTHTGAETLETIVMPQTKVPIGFEALPEEVRNSEILLAKEVARLASEYATPDPEKVRKTALEMGIDPKRFNTEKILAIIQELIRENNPSKALELAFLMEAK